MIFIHFVSYHFLSFKYFDWEDQPQTLALLMALAGSPLEVSFIAIICTNVPTSRYITEIINSVCLHKRLHCHSTIPQDF